MGIEDRTEVEVDMVHALEGTLGWLGFAVCEADGVEINACIVVLLGPYEIQSVPFRRVRSTCERINKGK